MHGLTAGIVVFIGIVTLATIIILVLALKMTYQDDVAYQHCRRNQSPDNKKGAEVAISVLKQRGWKLWGRKVKGLTYMGFGEDIIEIENEMLQDDDDLV